MTEETYQKILSDIRDMTDEDYEKMLREAREMDKDRERQFGANPSNPWQTGIPEKDGLYVIQIHPYGSMNRDPAYACYYIKDGILKDCVDTEPIEAESFWNDYAIKWMKISY